MIHIEVLKSSIPDAIGLYEFEFDQLSVGRSKKCDLIFLDKGLPLEFLIIHYSSSHLIVKSTTKDPAYYLNGKKVSGSLRIKPGDIISFGEQEIKIVAAEKTKQDEDLSAVYEKFNQEAGELKFALEFIEETLVEMEEKQNV
jgi:pSer/pThr/pTyr-binding forkhead associated (FHA) protein